MPDIPVYGGPRVERAGLPNVRLDPNAPQSAFGVPAAVDLGPVAKAARSIWEQEQEKANNTAVVGIAADMSRAETEILYGPAGHPELGVLNHRGEKALGAPDAARESWQKRSQEILLNKAHNEVQRAKAQQLAAQYEGNIFSAVQRHVSDERQKLDEVNLKTFLANEQDAVASNYHNPERIAMSIGLQQAAIKDFGAKQGMPEEWTKQATADAASKSHMKVIELMSSANDIGTKQYFEAHRGEMQGDDLVRAQKITEEATVRGEGQRQADAIVAKATDRFNAQQLAKEIQDPDVRAMAEQNIDHFYNVQKQAEAEKLNDLYIQASNIIDKNRGAPARSVIPPAMWQQFTPEHKAALTRYAESSAQLDVRAWLTFVEMRPEELGKMNQDQYYMKFRTRFDERSQNIADAVWGAARQAVANGKFDAPKLTEFYGNHERIYNTLRRSGFLSDPNKPYSKMSDADALMINEFERTAEARINEYEMSHLNGKRPANPEEKQKVLDDMVAERVFINRPILRDPERMAALVTKDELNRAYVPTDKIPPESKASLENLLKARGQKAPKEVIERLYAAQIIDGREFSIQLSDPNSAINQLIGSGAEKTKPVQTLPPSKSRPPSTGLNLTPLDQKKQTGGAGRDF